MEKLTRKEQKTQTRTVLIEVAEKMFSKNGIAATSTAEVAKSSGVSHGTLFVHFPTRDELILAVVDKFGERLAMALGAKCDSTMELKDQLKAHVGILSEFEDFYLRMISESLVLPSQIRGQFYALNSSLSYRFFHAARSGIKLGEYKKMDQAQFTNTWLGILHFHIMNRDLFSNTTPLLKYKGEDLVKLFLMLIKSN
jgi:AcrR family transcriptional regulator